MNAPARMRVMIAAACLAAGSCGGPTLMDIEETVPNLGESDQSARCKVVKDASRPMLVEWPATDKAALQVQTAQGIAVARYDGCRLKLLTGCRVKGDYTFLETSRAKDGFRIADEAELFAKLPLGAVSLEGEIKQGHELSLSYVAVGAKTTTESVSADRMRGSCEGATHFVRAMIVGAYELSSRASASGKAGVYVAGVAGAGGGAKKEGEVLRADGDLQGCLDPSTPATSQSCQAIVQLDLSPIEEGAEAARPAPAAKPSTPATKPKDDKPKADTPKTEKPTTEKPKADKPVAGCDRSPTGKGGPMCRVPAGTFKMGCNAVVDDKCDGDEKPAHAVALAPFYIDQHEVTVSEYTECVADGACERAGTTGDCNWGKEGRGEHPVNCVTWLEAKAYCEWAGKRLPTEAEWELAARGTDGRMNPWGNTPVTCERAVFAEIGGSGGGCGKRGTWPVCSKAGGASPFGPCDMIGNVWEWVSDWYAAKYYATSPKENPLGPETGSMNLRVKRGGSWRNEPLNARASDRGWAAQEFAGDDTGFRCAADAK